MSTNSGFSFTIWAKRRPSYRSFGLVGERGSVVVLAALLARVVEIVGRFQS